jgi:hypothetical protein
LYAVSLPGPRSLEKLDTTAGEQENPSLNRAAASSGFFMPEVLVRLRSIDQGSGWCCITVGLRVSFLEITPGKMDYN